MFGGDCCRPIACRRIARTVTMNGKQVTVIASAGARLSTVTSRKSWTPRAESVSGSSRMPPSCAASGPGRHASASAAARVAARRPAPGRNGEAGLARKTLLLRAGGIVGDLGETHRELAAAVALRLLELAAGDQPIADIQFDR